MPETILEPHERQQLTRILAEWPEFADSGPRGRRTLLSQAGLGRFASGMDLSGAPRVVAGDLIDRLEKYGELPDRPGCHALGALLDYLQRLPDVPRDDASFVADLIVKYALLTGVAPAEQQGMLRTEANGEPTRSGPPSSVTSAVVTESAKPSVPTSTSTAGGTMTRRMDLEQHIRDSYEIIRGYEMDIQVTNRHEEKLRAGRMIEEQWGLIEGYLAEYRPLVSGDLPPDIAEVAARFTASSQGDHIEVRGSGAVATRGSVAAGQGGIAIGGDVHGDIHLGSKESDE